MEDQKQQLQLTIDDIGKYEEEIPNFRLIVSILCKMKNIQCAYNVKTKYLITFWMFLFGFILIELINLNFFDHNVELFNFLEFIFFWGVILLPHKWAKMITKNKKLIFLFISRYVENEKFSLSELHYINNFINDNYHVELIKTDYSIISVINQIDKIITKYKINTNQVDKIIF